MPLVDVVVECPVHESFRVRQVAGMFDLPLQKSVRERFCASVPGVEEDWQIGVIVGPSGSGKSTVARAAFGDHLYQGGNWAADRAVVDGFGEAPIREITTVLTSVGFSSPPAWMKPYRVLSNGEKFRCDLARALLRAQNCGENKGVGDDYFRRSQGPRTSEFSKKYDENNGVGYHYSSRLGPLVVFDEFTSVVDRTVAKIGSAAIAKGIRSGRIRRRFVAVTCHYDVVQWLEPDWVLDMASGTLNRGRLRRPEIRLEIRRVRSDMWGVFKRHHYLSGELHRSATCFAGFIDGTPATFTAALFFPHPMRPGWREHRTVCLPDFQGVGLGNAMSEFVAGVFRATGKPYYSTTSHPAMIRHRCRSPLWRVTRRPGTAVNPHRDRGMRRSGSVGRLTGGFEFVGPARPEDARRLGVRMVEG